MNTCHAAPARARRFRLELIAATLWIGVMTCPDAYSQVNTGIVRVAPTGSDQSGCGSVALPCQSLQFAVNAFPSDGTGVILAATGTYTSPQPREVIRVAGKRLTIQGGFTMAFTAYDPDANPVIIDGENARSCVTTEPLFNADRTHLTLIGLTLTRGNAALDLSDMKSAFGGGLNAFESTVLVIDVDVIDNTAVAQDRSSEVPGNGGGGGLSFRQATGVLSDVTLIGNSAIGGNGTGVAAIRGGLGAGGGVFSFESIISMNGVVARDNIARAGDAPNSIGDDAISQSADGHGGFWASNFTRAEASRLVVTGNQSFGGSGATFGGLALGGAIFFEHPSAPVHLQDVVFRDNQGFGGDAVGNPSMQNSLAAGGAIFAEDAELTIERGVFVGNLAQSGDGTTVGGSSGGGAIYMNAVRGVPVSLDATNVIIAGNTSRAGLGATPGFAFGGGIFAQAAVSTSVTNLTHVTFADNIVEDGEFNQGAAAWVGPGAILSSSFGIVSGHTSGTPGTGAGEAILVLGQVGFDDTLWHGNTEKFFPFDSSFTDTSPSMGDPAYVDPTGTPPDYHIGSNSAALDAAEASTSPFDVDADPRPFEPQSGSGVADLGADEFQPMPVTPSAPGTRLFSTEADDGTLFQIDPATGDGRRIGAGPPELVGLSDFGGQLFALWEDDQLLELDPETGSVLFSTRLGIGVGAEGAMALDANGTGFTTRGLPNSSQLWRFDLSGSAPAIVGADQGAVLDGLAFAPNGDLLALSDDLTLLRIEPSSGERFTLGATGISAADAAGLAFSSQGVLHAVVGDQLYSLDSVSGSASPIGGVGADGRLSGLAFVPEPGLMWARVTALAALYALATFHTKRDTGPTRRA
jgi:hypothetical protein